MYDGNSQSWNGKIKVATLAPLLYQIVNPTMDCRSSTHSMVSLLSLLIAALAVCSLPASSYIIGSTSQQKSFSYSSKIRFATAVKRMSGRGTNREDGSPVTLYLLPTLSSIHITTIHVLLRLITQGYAPLVPYGTWFIKSRSIYAYCRYVPRGGKFGA